MKHTILFVDDEPNILSSLRRLFHKDGYQLLTAGSGKEGLEILKTQEVSLIVSDFRMPEMDGVEFLVEAQKIRPFALRVVLSGYAEIPIIVSAINYGKIYKFLTKPWDDYQLKLEIRLCLEQLELIKKNIQLVEDLRSTVDIMAMLPVAKDSYQDEGHCHRVAEICLKIGQQLNFSSEELHDLELAAKLHDLGNIWVSSEILNKPDALSPEEKNQVNEHTSIICNVLNPIKMLEPVLNIIRHHHENYDGSGYPDGLRGEEISLGARILYVAEVYDALLSSRPYRLALQKEDATKFMKENMGKLFDPKIIETLLLCQNP